VKSENNGAQGGYSIKSSGRQSPTFTENNEFYKTLNEFSSHDKLIKYKSVDNLLRERPSTAPMRREEKGINTSREI